MTLEAIHRALLTGPNPFEPTILPFDRNVAVPDVEEIHHAESQAILGLVDGVRRTGRSRGLLLRGESGTGKTHLLRRVARKLSGRALFAAIDPIGAPTRLKRHILRRLVTELSGPSADYGTVLRELAGALLAEGIYALPKGREKDQLLDQILAAPPGFMQEEGDLRRECLERSARALADGHQHVDLDVARVLLRVWVRDHEPLARDWLKGVDLDDEELRVLQVERSLTGEEDAQAALRSLVGGARLFRPVVLCFDQTETLLSLGGEAVVEALFHAVAELLALPGVAIVFTCLEDVWEETMRRVSERIDPAPLQGEPLALTRLGPKEARSIVACRLSGALDDHEAPYDTYPVPERTLEAMRDLSPREILEHCGRRLEAMRAEGAIAEIEPPRPRDDAALSEASSEALDIAWTDACAVGPLQDPTEETVLDGVQHLLRVAEDRTPEGWPSVRGLAREERPGGLRVQAGDDRVRIVVSATQNGTALARLLEKLLEGTEGPRGLRTVLLRLVPERGTWRVANAQLKRLEGLGGRVVRPDRKTLAALMAVRHIAARVAGGEVAGGGRAVTDRELVGFLGARASLGDLLGGLLERGRGG